MNLKYLSDGTVVVAGAGAAGYSGVINLGGRGGSTLGANGEDGKAFVVGAGGARPDLLTPEVLAKWVAELEESGK